MASLQFYVRYVWSWIVMVGGLLAFFPFIALEKLLTRTPGSPTFTFFVWSKLVSVLIGIDVKFEGNTELLDSRKSKIFVMNHQSQMDIFAVSQHLPYGMRVIAKKSLLWFPVINICLLVIGALLIDRSKGKKSMEQLMDAAKQLGQDGSSIAIFPEGTRSRGKQLLPFKRGAFEMAKTANVDIVPVVLSHYTNTSSKDLVYNSEAKVFRSGVITVRVMDPIPPTTRDTAQELADYTRTLMSNALEIKDE
eukprot:m.298247 g.298247  ORF g.298247 m.298247 type:complete len:249 (+) comp15860_c0_seq11:244-990(+)